MGEKGWRTGGESAENESRKGREKGGERVEKGAKKGRERGEKGGRRRGEHCMGSRHDVRMRYLYLCLSQHTFSINEKQTFSIFSCITTIKNF